MKTARQLVVEVFAEWMGRSDIEQMARGLAALEAKELEDLTEIREYGKWCSRTEIQLGYKPQIRFRGSRPESTEFESIRELSDQSAMRIHAATIGLSDLQREAIYRLYQYRQPFHIARAEMRVGTGTLDALKLSALQHIANRLSIKG